MCSTKKGGNRHFGMKLYIDVDKVWGLIQNVTTTAANIHDVTLADKLRASNLEILLDAGYLSIRKYKSAEPGHVSYAVANYIVSGKTFGR